jgi:broad specificity phosphatase PhoE
LIEQLILVRHGETLHNVSGVTQGWNDSALSVAGERQIRQLAEKIRQYQPTALFSSPLPRAVSTANAISGITGLEVQLLEDLREMNYGEWEGQSFVNIRAEQADQFRRFVEDPACRCPGGESHLDVRARMRRAFETISAAGARAIAVSHATAIRVGTTALLNVEVGVSRHLAIDNASINIFIRRGDRFVLKLWNDTSHCINSEP